MSQFHTPGQWDKGPEQFFDNPMPPVLFAERRFCLTGVFAFGKRQDVEREIKERGGEVMSKPSKAGCYVVVGTLSAKEWVTPDAGRKLLEAIKLREQQDCPIFIISEDHLMEAILNTQPAPQQKPDPEAFWKDMLEAWLAPLAQHAEMPFYEVTLTKSMAAVHLPGKKDARICTIRFAILQQYREKDWRIVPSSLDIPGYGAIYIDGSQSDWDGNTIDPVRTRSLPTETLDQLRVRLEKISV